MNFIAEQVYFFKPEFCFFKTLSMRTMFFAAIVTCCCSSSASGDITGVGDLPGGNFSSFALDVSSDGSVVVGVGFTSNGQEAFHWTNAGSMQLLSNVLLAQGDDLSHWQQLTKAQAISDDGKTIVGFGTNISGGTEAFIATINSIPEPSSLMLFGSVGLAWYSTRRRRLFA